MNIYEFEVESVVGGHLVGNWYCVYGNSKDEALSVVRGRFPDFDGELKLVEDRVVKFPTINKNPEL